MDTSNYYSLMADYSKLISEVCEILGYHVVDGMTAKDHILLKDASERYAFTLHLYEKKGWKIQVQLYWWLGNQAIYLKDHSRFDRHDTQEITVSATKGAKAIAADIKRRLLDVYLKDVDQAYATLEKRTTIENRCKDNTRKLAAIIGSKPSEANDQRVYDWLGGKPGDLSRVRVDATVGDKVDLKLHGLPMDLAAELLEMLRDRLTPTEDKAA